MKTIERVSFVMAQFALANPEMISPEVPSRCPELPGDRVLGPDRARTGELFLDVKGSTSLHVFCGELQDAGFALVGATVQARSHRHTRDQFTTARFTFVPIECIDRRHDAFREIEPVAQAALDHLTRCFFWRDVRFHQNPRTRGEFKDRDVFWTMNAKASHPAGGLPDSFISLGSRPVVNVAGEYLKLIAQ